MKKPTSRAMLPRTRKPTLRELGVTEETIQRQIIDALEMFGYRAMVTSRRRRPCPNCGEMDHRGDGVSRGLPDLVITRDSWPRLVACLIEVKGPETEVSPEQAELADLGRIVIARDAAEALRAVRAVDALLRTLPKPDPERITNGH